MAIGGTVGRVRVRSQRVRQPEVLQPVAALMLWCWRKSGVNADTDGNSGRFGTLKSTSKNLVESIESIDSDADGEMAESEESVEVSGSEEGIVSRGRVEIRRKVETERR